MKIIQQFTQAEQANKQQAAYSTGPSSWRPNRAFKIVGGVMLLLAVTIALVQAATVITTITTVGVGTTPYDVAVNTVTNRIYVANQGNSTVSVINGSTNALLATISVGGNPVGVGVNSSTNLVYVSKPASN